MFGFKESAMNLAKHDTTWTVPPHVLYAFFLWAMCL